MVTPCFPGLLCRTHTSCDCETNLDVTFAVFGVSCALQFLAVSHFVAMAEPNQDQPTEPTEPERYLTETDDVSESSTSSGGDVQVTPTVHVEPPLTRTQPPIFYIPIPSPGDPVPLIPTKAFVVRQPKSVFLSDFAVQSTSTGVRPFLSTSGKSTEESRIVRPSA